MAARRMGPKNVKACMLFDSLMNEQNISGSLFRSEVPLISVNGNYDADDYFEEMMQDYSLGEINDLRHKMHDS